MTNVKVPGLHQCLKVQKENKQQQNRKLIKMNSSIQKAGSFSIISPPFKVNHDLASPAFTGIKQRGMELMEGGNRMRMERKVYVRVEIHQSQKRGRR